MRHPDLTDKTLEAERQAIENDRAMYLECLNGRPLSERYTLDDQRQGLILFHHVYKVCSDV